MTLRVISIDFDGCLFNYNYLHSVDKDVIKYNQSFLNTLKQQSQAFAQTITMIGSARQSKELDMRGARKNNTGSCFLAMQHITRYLTATFNPLLFSDIIGDFPEGTSYKRLTSNHAHQEKHACAMFDDNKIMILYTQMQRIALQTPMESITFDFYDDRHDILNSLNRFFKENPDMIPSHISLRLHQYAGQNINPVATIQGMGPTNHNYRQTVIDMLEGWNSPLKVDDYSKSPLIFPTKKTETLQAYIKTLQVKDDQTAFDLQINMPPQVSIFSCCLPLLSWFSPKQPEPKPTLKRVKTSVALSEMAV